MNWLITGGCGFIGTNLVQSIRASNGGRIRILDNLSVGSRADLARVTEFVETEASAPKPMGEAADAVELVVGDVLDEALTARVAHGADVIVHLAANTGVAPSVEDPRYDCVTNVIGTLNMLEAARHAGVGRFVLASSGAPIGEVEPPIHEELAPHPKSPYGASKLAGEGYCSAYHGSFGLDTVGLRFGNVYGPLSSHKSSVVAKFARRAMQGDVLEIYGDGGQTRDFIYTADLVEAIRLAATVDGIGGEIFQIATNAETTVNELVDALVPILEEFGVDAVEVRHTSPRTGDVRRNYSDTSKAKRLLGWQPRVSLAQGLVQTVRWFAEQDAE